MINQRRDLGRVASDEFQTFLSVTQFDADYLAWQSSVLAALYPLDVFQLCGQQNVSMRRFAPSAFSSPRTGFDAFNFSDLVDLKRVRSRRELVSDESSRFVDYMTRPGGPVRFPDRSGFEPLRWNFDESSPFVEMGVTRYRDMMACGFDLQYEIFQQYGSVAPKQVVTPMRHRLGLLRDRLAVARTDFHSFHPSFGVQALVVIVRGGVPRVVLMTRSMHLAALPGWLQFPPSGAMEAFDIADEWNIEEYRRQMDPGRALRREFLEELFDVSESKSGGWDAFQMLSVSPDGTRLGEAFTNGSASVQFVGVVADSMTFRPELSFVIVAHEVDWELIHSDEAKVLPSMVTFEDLAAKLSHPEVQLCPSSASLLRLAIDSNCLDVAGVLSSADASRLFD